jgi:hypothetical protein
MYLLIKLREKEVCCKASASSQLWIQTPNPKPQVYSHTKLEYLDVLSGYLVRKFVDGDVSGGASFKEVLMLTNPCFFAMSLFQSSLRLWICSAQIWGYQFSIWDVGGRRSRSSGLVPGLLHLRATDVIRLKRKRKKLGVFLCQRTTSLFLVAH